MVKPRKDQKTSHGGRRPGSGRPPKPGWSGRTVYLRLVTWRAIQKVVKQRKARGLKGVSATSIIDEAISKAIEGGLV